MAKIKKLIRRTGAICCLLATVGSTIGFAACGDNGGTGGAEKIDPKRTQLYVSNWDGGVGTQWLYNIEKEFEEAYKDVCFEPGTNKQGVQIIVTPNKTASVTLTTTLPGSSDEVFFAEDIPYYEWVSKGLLADISDVVTNPVADGESSVESRMTEEQKQDFTALDGKYYVLPHYETFRGIQYDIDLFESKMLYFAENPDNGNNGFITSKTEARSKGPDGKTGVIDGVDYSLDDGLPSTYEEFYKLMDYMLTRNVTPFIWNGLDNCGYLDYAMEAAVNAYSTKVEANLPLTFSTGDETARIITGFDGNGNPIVENLKVDENTGYYTLQQSARYYALQMLEKMLSDTDYYYSLSTNTTFSHTDAQEQFIYSSLENKPIAMIVDGTWWENETKISGALERTISDYGEKAENRNYGWMPLPSKVDANDPGKEDFVMKDALRSYAFINGNLKNNENKLNLAKTFLKFCYTEKALTDFTVETGIPRALKYDLTDSQKSQLTSYARNVWEYRSRADVVYNLSGNKIYMNNETKFVKEIWHATVKGEDYIGPYSAYRSSSNIGATDYFKGLWIDSETWVSRYRQFFSGSD